MVDQITLYLLFHKLIIRVVTKRFSIQTLQSSVWVLESIPWPPILCRNIQILINYHFPPTSNFLSSSYSLFSLFVSPLKKIKNLFIYVWILFLMSILFSLFVYRKAEFSRRILGFDLRLLMYLRKDRILRGFGGWTQGLFWGILQRISLGRFGCYRVRVKGYFGVVW